MSRQFFAQHSWRIKYFKRLWWTDCSGKRDYR